MKTLLYCAVSLVFAAGCARQPLAPHAAAFVPQAAADTRPEIACFGDSLTAGFGLDASDSYPYRLQLELNKRGYRYRVVNFGFGGATTEEGLEALPKVLADKPALVVLELGANDGLRNQPVAKMRENLSNIIAALERSGARVVLAGITLPPLFEPAYLAEFQRVYPELAEKYRTPLIPFLLDGVAGNERLMQHDGLHPNAAGSQVVAETVFRALEPLIAKTR